MSIKNLASNKVSVFPATRRDSEYDTSSKIFTESNIVLMVGRMSSIKSYVVSSNEDILNNNPFVFILGGYLFVIPTVTEILKLFPQENDTTKIYSYIVLDASMQNPELVGQDENGIYTGLFFSNEKVAIWDFENIYHLQILEKEQGKEWSLNNINIPGESKYVFTDETMKIDIDGGIIPFLTEG